MSNEQLYLAIGIPMVFNTVLYLAFTANVNRRFDDFQAFMAQRFDDLKALWQAELSRVEGVIDARMKHLEEQR